MRGSDFRGIRSAAGNEHVIHPAVLVAAARGSAVASIASHEASVVAGYKQLEQELIRIRLINDETRSFGRSDASSVVLVGDVLHSFEVERLDDAVIAEIELSAALGGLQRRF